MIKITINFEVIMSVDQLYLEEDRHQSLHLCVEA